MTEENKISPVSQGNYLVSSRHNDLIFTAGITPRVDGKLIRTGKFTSNVTEKEKEIVECAVKNALYATKNELNTNEKIEKVLSLSVYLNVPANFKSHSKLADLASNYLYEHLGESGVGSRVAIGVSSLPGDAPLEVQLISSVKKK